MIKLIVLDCDGTLLNSSKQISEKTYTVLKQAIDKNYKIMIASGRPFYRVQSIIHNLGIEESDQYTISYNGALVTNNTGDKKVVSYTFPKFQIDELIKIGQMLDVRIFLYSDNQVFSDIDDFNYRTKNPDANFVVMDFNTIDYDLTPIYKVSFVIVPKYLKKVQSKLPVYLYSKFDVSLCDTDTILFGQKAATKANALSSVVTLIGVSRNEIIAFGDQENDISMLEFSEIGVAMGNSTELVKSFSNYTTGTNDQDGIADALVHFGIV